jgi:hypothetical protein
MQRKETREGKERCPETPMGVKTISYPQSATGGVPGGHKTSLREGSHPNLPKLQMATSVL